MEKDHNLQSSALSQSKNDHSGTLNVYICKHGNHSGGPLRLAENTPERLLKNSMCYTEWKSKGRRTLINKTIYCHIVLKIWMTFIYPLSGPNQCRKQMKKKPIATDMRQNRWLFTSFTKELNLGLPKLLSLTDLYENFVMWPTVQELLLDIVVFVSLVNSK